MAHRYLATKLQLVRNLPRLVSATRVHEGRWKKARGVCGFILIVKKDVRPIAGHVRLRRGVKVQVYSFFNLDVKWRWVVNATLWPLYPREGDAVPIQYGARSSPEPVWTCAENLAPTGIRYPDRPVRIESLYRLSHPGPLILVVVFVILQ